MSKEWLSPEDLEKDSEELISYMEKLPKHLDRWNLLDKPVSRTSFTIGEDKIHRNAFGETLQEYLAQAKPVPPVSGEIFQLTDRQHLKASPEYRKPE